MPDRIDFRLGDFAQWIPNFFLVDTEVKEDVPAFTFRLVGSDIEATARANLTRANVQTVIPSQEPGSLYESYKNCWLTREPNYQYMQMKHPSGGFSRFERLVLPVEPAADGKPSMLCGAAFFDGMWREKFLGGLI